MKNPAWGAILAAIVGVVAVNARADDADQPSNHEKIDQGRRALSAMREAYAFVANKEQAAHKDGDPILLNTLHSITLRIGDLVNVAKTSLDDMGVAIASNEPLEAVDAELEKITLARIKVDEARREAERAVGKRLIVDPSETTQVQVYDTISSALSDPVTGLTAPAPITVPIAVLPPCPASSAGSLAPSGCR